jgi:hypothetical protein
VDTLSKRYDLLTKSAIISPVASNDSHVIDLGDSEDEYIQPRKASPTPVKQSIPIHSSKRALSEELEEVEDPEVVAFRAAARARAAAKKEAEEKAAREAQASTSDAKSACVQLLITSQLPDTRPIMMKVRVSDTIERPRTVWCAKQGFTPAQTNDLFLTYKDRRVYDSTTIQVLGIKVDDHGNVSVPGDATIYDEHNLPKIALDAWTPKFKEQWEREEAEEAAARKKAVESRSLFDEPEPEPEPEPDTTFRVVMVEKGQRAEAGVGMKVHPVCCMVTSKLLVANLV